MLLLTTSRADIDEVVGVGLNWRWRMVVVKVNVRIGKLKRGRLLICRLDRRTEVDTAVEWNRVGLGARHCRSAKDRPRA